MKVLNAPTSIKIHFASMFNCIRSTCIQCHSCHQFFESTETIYVALPIPSFPAVNSSIQSSIKNWLEPAYLCGPNQYNCPTCRTKQNATQYSRMKQWPAVLTLFLQMSPSTVTNGFSITEQLELPGCSTPYKLQSLSLFQGKDADGHYISMVNCKRDWTVYSDKIYFKAVHIEDWKRLHTTSVSSYPSPFVPYLLFYERIPDATQTQHRDAVSTPKPVCGLQKFVKVNLPSFPTFQEQMRGTVELSFPSVTHSESDDSQSSQSSDLNICPYCSKVFSRWTSVQRHKAVHSLERPWKCRFFGCNRAFYRKDKRDEHEASHMHGGTRERTVSSESSGGSDIMNVRRCTGIKRMHWRNVENIGS